ncbi:MAG: hypothetical protein ACRENA_15315 [Vulcanimicrobiaceae bacterium]
MRLLFVSNGHGEIAIASRIAAESRHAGAQRTDHFPLVGVVGDDPQFASVGPQRAMPSGGLVAMGNVPAFARDVAAGFVPLWRSQRAFLRDAGLQYDSLVAVGDVYCLFMATAAKLPTIFVGTAKSVYVARYGRFERKLMKEAKKVFVRDAATAEDLRSHGIAAESPGNVIADLSRSDERFAWSGTTRIVVLPGSRGDAYENAARVGAILAGLSDRAGIEIVVSIAPGIDAERMLRAFAIPARAWNGPLGAIFSDATLAVGQAGTANEAAAAAGVPVVALADPSHKEDWYRMRQRRLLDGALALVPADPTQGAQTLRALLDDETRRAEMSRIGRERIGPPGAATAIAAAVLATAN